jgi:hypothetical protein
MDIDIKPHRTAPHQPSNGILPNPSPPATGLATRRRSLVSTPQAREHARCAAHLFALHVRTRVWGLRDVRAGCKSPATGLLFPPIVPSLGYASWTISHRDQFHHTQILEATAVRSASYSKTSGEIILRKQGRKDMYYCPCRRPAKDVQQPFAARRGIAAMEESLPVGELHNITMEACTAIAAPP